MITGNNNDQKTSTAIFACPCGILRRLYIHWRIQALLHTEDVT